MAPPRAVRVWFRWHWLLTVLPGIWLLTVFAESLWGRVLIGYLPNRAVAMPEADLATLKQDVVFQLLSKVQEGMLGVVAVGLIAWIPLTLILMGLKFVHSQRDRWLQAIAYGLLHVGIYGLQLYLYAAEPTHRADWLFD